MTHPERAPKHRVGMSKKTRITAGGICERSGKRQFPTQRDAVKAAALIKSENGRKRRKALATNVYQCGCGSWHLSRMTAKGGAS